MGNNLFVIQMSDLAYTIFFILFIIYSTAVVPVTVASLQGTKTGGHYTASDYSVMVNGLSSVKEKVLTGGDLRVHFQQWGKISEVKLGRWYQGMFTEYKELADMIKDRKKLATELEIMEAEQIELEANETPEERRAREEKEELERSRKRQTPMEQLETRVQNFNDRIKIQEKAIKAKELEIFKDHPIRSHDDFPPHNAFVIFESERV